MKWQYRSSGSFPFRKTWIGGQESVFRKEEGNATVFLWYYKGVTFITNRCSLQLANSTHFNFSSQKKFESRTSFAACGCRFANYFFCNCTWTINLLVILFKSVCCQVLCELFWGNSIGKKLVRLDWEKAVYWSFRGNIRMISINRS